MKATVRIFKYGVGYCAKIEINNDFLSGHERTIFSKTHYSKGQLKRKVIQFCGEMNLEVSIIGE